ncbi:lysozyme inhibitor LprI family protein [Pseudomonas veronii]
MRMLAVVTCTVGALFASQAFASGDCDKASTKTRDIFQCVNHLYEKVDKKLNEQYSTMLASHGLSNKNLLREGERAWIKFRDSHCIYIYESALPGEEAGIEKMGCLISLTSSRLVELLYLDTGANGDSFYNSLSLMSSIFSKNRDEILSYIENVESPPEETEYYKKNCELTGIIYAENERLCRARMKFQSMSVLGHS